MFWLLQVWVFVLTIYLVKLKKKKNPFKLISNGNSEMNLDGNLELKANKTYRTELKWSKLKGLN